MPNAIPAAIHGPGLFKTSRVATASTGPLRTIANTAAASNTPASKSRSGKRGPSPQSRATTSPIAGARPVPVAARRKPAQKSANRIPPITTAAWQPNSTSNSYARVGTSAASNSTMAQRGPRGRPPPTAPPCQKAWRISTAAMTSSNNCKSIRSKGIVVHASKSGQSAARVPSTACSSIAEVTAQGISRATLPLPPGEAARESSSKSLNFSMAISPSPGSAADASRRCPSHPLPKGEG